MNDQDFSYDPSLIDKLSVFLDHDKLEESIKPQLAIWVRERFDYLLERYFIKSELWLAQAVQRQAENDPITEADRMAIWKIADTILAQVALPDTHERKISYIRALLSLGYVLAKEGLDGKSSGNKDKGDVGGSETPKEA